MERIEGLSIGLDLETVKVDSGLKDLKSKLTLVNSEMKANLSAFDRSERSVGKYETRLNGLNKKIEVQRAVTENARKTYSKMVDEFGEGSKEAEKAASEYNKQSSNLQNLERYIDRTKDALEKLKEEQRIANSNWTKMGDQMTVAGDKMQKFGKGMTDFGKSYTMGVTAPIVASGVAVFKTASDYESAFAGVAKTFSGTEEQLAALRVGIRDMAKEIPASTTEISAVAEAAGQLGIKAESIEEFTRTMIDLGEATNMTSDQAATEFARFANIVGMSQDDFDKMGSSIVALGNSMATTEAEISSMAMRLAAQGKQVGMTESQILALSASMSSLGIESEAGGTAMTTVLKKIDSAVDESDVMLDEFAKTARMSSSEFAKVWEKEPIKALDMFIKGLAESSSEGANLTSILSDLGIKGIRESDTILRLAGASDLLSEAVGTSSDAWKENTALSDEAAQRYATTESKLKILWNRAKDMGITLGEALVPAVMDLLDAAEPLIKQIEDGAQAFADMSEEEQQTILKTIALVAALGPAAIGVGALSSGIGGLLTVSGNLSKTIGVASGKGTAGSLALLGKGGVTGLAIAGVAALGLVVFDHIKKSKEAKEVNLDLAKSFTDQAVEIENSADIFDKLSSKAKISNEQLAELNDLNIRISESSNPDEIDELQKRYNDLARESGLSKDELNELFTANKNLIEQAPNAKKSISEHGNAFVENTEKVRDYINTLYEASLVELKAERVKQLEREKELMAELEKSQSHRNNLERELQYFLDAQNMTQDEIWDRQEEINELYYHGNLSQKEKNELMREHGALQDALTGDIVKEIQKRQDKLKEQNKSVDSTQEELDKIRAMDEEMASIILKQIGINEETAKQAIKNGEIDDLLNSQITALQKQKNELYKQADPAEQVEDSFKESVKAIDDQIGKLKGAKNNITDLIGGAEEYNKELSKDINKTVNTRTNPSVADINRQLGATITKTLMVNPALGRGITAISPYAKGTPPGGHPGGLAVVGDGGGSELIHTPDGRSFLSPSTDTIMDLPKGTHVIPHEKTKRLLSFTPKYAGGTRNWESLFNLENANEFMKLLALLGKSEKNSHENSQAINRSNTSNNSQQLTQLIEAIQLLASRPVSFQINGHEFVRIISNDMSNELQRLFSDALRGEGYI